MANEKISKSWFDKASQDLRLAKLSAAIAQIDQSLGNRLQNADQLTKYAISYRYPDAIETPLEIQSLREAIVLAEKVYDELSSHLPFEVFK